MIKFDPRELTQSRLTGLLSTLDTEHATTLKNAHRYFCINADLDAKLTDRDYAAITQEEYNHFYSRVAMAPNDLGLSRLNEVLLQAHPDYGVARVQRYGKAEYTNLYMLAKCGLRYYLTVNAMAKIVTNVLSTVSGSNDMLPLSNPNMLLIKQNQQAGMTELPVNVAWDDRLVSLKEQCVETQTDRELRQLVGFCRSVPTPELSLITQLTTHLLEVRHFAGHRFLVNWERKRVIWVGEFHG